jgi:hypothetical protein
MSPWFNRIGVWSIVGGWLLWPVLIICFDPHPAPLPMQMVGAAIWWGMSWYLWRTEFRKRR